MDQNESPLTRLSGLASSHDAEADNKALLSDIEALRAVFDTPIDSPAGDASATPQAAFTDPDDDPAFAPVDQSEDLAQLQASVDRRASIEQQVSMADELLTGSNAIEVEQVTIERASIHNPDAEPIIEHVTLFDRPTEMARYQTVPTEPAPDVVDPPEGDSARTRSIRPALLTAGVLAVLVLGAIFAYGELDNDSGTVVAQETPQTVAPTTLQSTTVPTSVEAAVIDEPHRAIVSADGITLTGSVPTDEVSNAYIALATAAVGEENVSNELVMGESVDNDDELVFQVSEDDVFPDGESSFDLARSSYLAPVLEATKLSETSRLIIRAEVPASDDREADSVRSTDYANSVFIYLATEGNVDPSRMELAPAGVEPHDGGNLLEIRLIGLLG